MSTFPVGMPWIESPYAEQLLAASDADPAWVALARSYHRDGFVVFDFPIENMERLASDVQRTLVGKYGAERRTMNAWRRNPHVRAIACAPQVLKLLQFLYGRAPIPFQTLNFDVGTQQRMHSDAMHFHSWPARYMCGVWLALEDVDATNGPLMYYEGSHRLPVLNLDDLGIRHLPTSAQRYGIYEEFIERLAEANDLRRRTIPLRRGQAVLWSANLLHGGSAIEDPQRTRHSQVTHYFFEDCTYHSPIQADVSPLNHFLMDVRDIRSGASVQRSRDFPGSWRRGRAAHVAHVLKHEGLAGLWERAKRKLSSTRA